ncbi:MAG: TonB-dependent receptor [Opitutaceae bacterium]|nr:TonB-dependent receptor [Opitutaceae bacterium]
MRFAPPSPLFRAWTVFLAVLVFSWGHAPASAAARSVGKTKADLVAPAPPKPEPPPPPPEPEPELPNPEPETAETAPEDPTKVKLTNADVITLATFEVKARTNPDDYDSTGLGQDETERSDPLFASPAMMKDVGDDVLPNAELDDQLAMTVNNSPADLASGVERVTLRGFPIPRRRNGFTQAGFPAGLPSAGSEIIRGILVPVVGRAAPGGINNTFAGRPRGRTYYTATVDASTHDRVGFYFNASGDLAPKKAWYYLYANMSEAHGPQNDAWYNQSNVMASAAIRHTRDTSSLLMFDYNNYHGNPSTGVPEYKNSTRASNATLSDPIIGPYKPLVNFNSGGPNASLWREYRGLSYQIESKLLPRLQSRAMFQWLGRDVEQERFTSGQFAFFDNNGNPYNKFTGVREPVHIEQAFNGLMAEGDLTWRVRLGKTEHKLLAAAEIARSKWDKLQRQLSTAERDKLPATARAFDPYNPDWTTVPYKGNEDKYSRLIVDQEEESTVAAGELSLRSSLWRGKTVATAGLRYDRVDTRIVSNSENIPAGQPRPRVSEGLADHVSWHAGVNQLLAKNRVMLFANVSTAFDPDVVVDIRTGELHGNEITKGFELGFKTATPDRRFSFLLLGFYYTNENIARTNPLYNDPIQDPDKTEPQLIDSGGQRFCGFQMQTGWRLTPALTLSLKYTYTDAINTQSPATIPDEDGNEMPRVPPNNGALGLRYAFHEGKLKGLSFGATLMFFDEVVANYDNYKFVNAGTAAAPDMVAVKTRQGYSYPAYFLLGLNTSYNWLVGKTRNTVTLSLRNALDADLEAKLARPNSGREAVLNWRLSL